MSADDFLPEYTSVPVGAGLCKPAYRLFTGQRLKIVPGSTVYDSAARATAAAKEYVRAKLNPPIRCEQNTAPADVLGIEDWRREREEKTAAERQRVFGDDAPATIFVRGKKPVKVETIRRRA